MPDNDCRSAQAYEFFTSAKKGQTPPGMHFKCTSVCRSGPAAAVVGRGC